MRVVDRPDSAVGHGGTDGWASVDRYSGPLGRHERFSPQSLKPAEQSVDRRQPDLRTADSTGNKQQT